MKSYSCLKKTAWHGCLLRWDLDDLTSGAILCHDWLSRQFCYTFLLYFPSFPIYMKAIHSRVK